MNRVRLGNVLTVAAVLALLLLPVTCAVGERISARTVANVDAYETQAIERAELWTTALTWLTLSVVAFVAGVFGVALVIGTAFAMRALRLARGVAAVQPLPELALVNGTRVDSRRALPKAMPVELVLRDTEALPALSRKEIADG